jgi:hypothetical protein
VTISTSTTNGCNYGATVTPSVGASPWTFTNTENVPIWFVVSAGTVTDISIAQSLGGLVSMGLLGGGYYLNPGHQIKITYAVAPTVTYWPV